MSKYAIIRFRKGLVSFFVDKKALKVGVILLLLTALVFVLSLGMGDKWIVPWNVLKTLLGQGSKMDTLVVTSFRLPRILVAMLAGMSLAAAGAILQGMIRNPLASPDIIGVTGGAAVAVLLFLNLFSDENNSLQVSIEWQALAAFLGAAVAALVVYGLSWKRGVAPLRFVLIGIGISLFAQAMSTLLMLVGPIYRASQANVWITGTVYGSSWDHVKVLLPWTLIFFTLAWTLARHLNIQELGDDVAKGAGSHVERNRFLLIAISTALTGGAVAFAGGIGFVGLIAPHMARRLVGSSFGALLPVSACLGAIMVMIADVIGRTLFLPQEVPAGVFTAAVGAPYFIYLLYRHRRL